MPKKEIKVEIVAETKNAEGKLATVSAALKSVANDAARASKQAGKIDDSGMKKWHRLQMARRSVSNR